MKHISKIWRIFLFIIIYFFSGQMWNWPNKTSVCMEIYEISKSTEWQDWMLNLLSQKTVMNTTLTLSSLWTPFPYYWNEWFQYLCSGVFRMNGISLTGKDAIRTFYFSEGLKVDPAAEQSYFCLQNACLIHTPTIDHDWDYHIKDLQMWFH